MFVFSEVKLTSSSWSLLRLKCPSICTWPSRTRATSRNVLRYPHCVSGQQVGGTSRYQEKIQIDFISRWFVLTYPSRQDRWLLSLLRLRRAVKKNVFWWKVCRQTTSRVFSSVPQNCSSQSPRVQTIIYCLPVPFTISCQVFLSCLSIFMAVGAALYAHLRGGHFQRHFPQRRYLKKWKHCHTRWTREFREADLNTCYLSLLRPLLTSASYLCPHPYLLWEQTVWSWNSTEPPCSRSPSGPAIWRTCVVGDFKPWGPAWENTDRGRLMLPLRCTQSWWENEFNRLEFRVQTSGRKESGMVEWGSIAAKIED